MQRSDANSVSGSQPERVSRIRRQGGIQTAVAISVILVMGFFLRFYKLGGPPIAYDEAYQTVVAYNWATTGVPLPPSGQAYTRGFLQISVQAFLMKFTPLSIEAAARLPSALAGMGSIALFFLLGQMRGSAGLGLLLAGIFAITPWFVQMGRFVRMYEPLLFFALISLVGYEAYRRSLARRYWSLMVVALCLAMAMHSLGLLLVLLPLAAAFTHRRQIPMAVSFFVAGMLPLGFKVFYGLFLDRLLPVSVAPPLVEAIGSERFALPTMESLSRLAGLTPAMPWLMPGIAALAAAIFCALAFGHLRETRNPWYLMVPVVALTTFFGHLMAGLATMALLHLATLRTPAAPSERLRVLRMGWICFIDFALFWLIAAGIFALRAESFWYGLRTFLTPLIAYPLFVMNIIRPMVLSLDTGHLFLAAMGLSALCILATWRKGPSFLAPEDADTRLLFLLGCCIAVGASMPAYSEERYLYFMIPAGMWLLFETLVRVWPVAPKWLKVPALAGAAVVLLGIDLPRSIEQLPGEDGRVVRRTYPAWLPDVRADWKRERASQLKPADYRVAGRFLKENIRPGDLVLTSSAHQLQTYWRSIHGHLSPALHEYRHGTRHYLTGSAYLRTPDELLGFLEESVSDSSQFIWLVLRESPFMLDSVIDPIIDQSDVFGGDTLVPVIFKVPAHRLLDELRQNKGEMEFVSKP